MNTTNPTRRVFTSALVVLCLSLPGLSAAAPKAKLWDFWNVSDESSSQSVDHSAWSALLKKFVNNDEDLNVVDYDGIASSAGDREALNSYVNSLAAVEVRKLARAEQMPYWINLYNALTVKVVVDSWPVGSIRDISDSLFSSGPWKRKLVTVEGEKLTLDDIEHRILRPIFKDNRIHYAVNCASIGCPNLQTVAFTRDNADALMTLGAKQFVNSPRGVIVDGNSVTVSSIYDWFEVDFGGNDAGVLAHLRKFADPGLVSKLEKVRKIGRDQYDWRVNAPDGSAPGNVMNGSDDNETRGEGS